MSCRKAWGFESHLGHLIPWSNGKGAWVTTRKVLVRFQPGSLLKKWSVGVSAAHLLGKEEDRVRLPDGPLGWLVPWRRLILARSVRWVRLPPGPLNRVGLWSNGTTPPWRGGNPGSIPGGSTGGN